MHKLITFLSRKGYARCLSGLTGEHEVKQFARLRTLVLPEQACEPLLQAVGKTKVLVSDDIAVRVHMAEAIPWGVKRVGAPELWKRTRGEGVKVAVIDTGISRIHPDLKDQVKGRVVIPNNGKGYGRINGHGTHVAGTIAAAANDRGIVGVAPSVELYDVRVFGPDGQAMISDVVAGINWAIENGMDIINMSFGTSEDHPALRHAIRTAARAGIILVASAGNNGGAVEYPAAYRNVVAVGAIDRQNRLAPFSARGSGLDVVAPGVGIRSTWLKKSYRELSGTSMAAAHISGLYALSLAGNRRRVRQFLTRNRYQALARQAERESEKRTEGAAELQAKRESERPSDQRKRRAAEHRSKVEQQPSPPASA